MLHRASQTKNLSKEMDAGLIRLIPKSMCKENTTNDSRPIMLLNTSYKIMAKALADRIKLLLPQLVKQEQFGFVHGHSIFDNVLNVIEAIDFATESSFPLVVLNIDTDKAYDRVEWSYV